VTLAKLRSVIGGPGLDFIAARIELIWGGMGARAQSLKAWIEIYRDRSGGMCAARRNLISAWALARATLRKRPIMSSRIDRSRRTAGRFVGDVLWLATIAFVFAIITGIVG